MNRISTPTALVLIGLIWLGPASSAESGPIAFFSDDPCRLQRITWDLSPAGIGIINIRLDLVSMDECEDNETAPGMGGWFGGGGFGGGGFGGGGFGGLIGGLQSGSSGFITPPTGTFAGEGQFELAPTSDLPGLPPSFDGDTPPIGGGGGGNDLSGIIGSHLNSTLMTYPLLLGDDFGTNPSGEVAGLQNVDDPSLTVVPEPGSFLLLGTGLALAIRRLRRR